MLNLGSGAVVPEPFFLVLYMKIKPWFWGLLVLGVTFILCCLLAFWVAGLFGQGSTLSFGQKVGIVPIKGVIQDSSKTLEDIIAFREDESVRAIVLRIDSPGGAVGPSQEIHNEVKKAAQVKPVVVSMGSVAASGGYYVAAAAHSIFANPGTLTGSIGVIMEFTNVEELFGMFGLKSLVVKSGEHKDIGSSVRPMTQEDRAILQALIDDVHSQFVDAVASGRNMEPARAAELSDGRIYTGRQALELGLVDSLGNLYDAVDKAASLAGIQGKPKLVFPREEKLSLMNYLVQEVATAVRDGVRTTVPSGLQFLWTGQ